MRRYIQTPKFLLTVRAKPCDVAALGLSPRPRVIAEHSTGPRGERVGRGFFDHSMCSTRHPMDGVLRVLLATAVVVALITPEELIVATLWPR